MASAADEDLWKDEDFLSFHDDKAPPSGPSKPLTPPPTSQSASGSSSRPEGGVDGNGIDTRSGVVNSPPFEYDLSDAEDDESEDDEESSSLPPWMEQVHPTDLPARRGGGSDSPRYQQRDVVPPLVRLHNEVVGYARLVEPTPKEVAVRRRLVRRVEQVAVDVFGPRAQVLVFGSQATGLYLPTSDIDLVVLTKSEQELKKEKDEQDKDGGSSFDPAPLRKFASGLREAWEPTAELSYLEVIENTRVPLVKFTHATTHVSIDVSFDLPDSGPPASTLMNTYLEALPPLRPLTLVAKSLLAARGLNQPYTGGVGSYMLQLMIVAFLQQRERDAVVHRRRPSLNLGGLLMDFLEFYGLDFNYVTTGISIRNDGFFFPKGASAKKEWFYAADRLQLMALENPLETTHDVGKSSFRISTVQRAFKVAHNVLLARTAESPSPASSSSLLAAVLPVTPEMVQRGKAKRRNLRRQLGRGRLERSYKSQSPASLGRGAAPPTVLSQPLSSKRYARNESQSSSSSSPDPNQRGRKRQRR